MVIECPGLHDVLNPKHFWVKACLLLPQAWNGRGGEPGHQDKTLHRERFPPRSEIGRRRGKQRKGEEDRMLCISDANFIEKKWRADSFFFKSIWTQQMFKITEVRLGKDYWTGRHKSRRFFCMLPFMCRIFVLHILHVSLGDNICYRMISGSSAKLYIGFKVLLLPLVCTFN